MDVVDRVSFVNKISLLMKATSDDDNPIPGYLYDDVNKISYESPGYCISLLEFLVSQLEKRSYHTKLKVLKLMAYIVEKGHPDFRHGLRRQATGIKEATKFSGPPDPLHGNIPYLMVRQTAQSLSEVLFDAERKRESETDPKKSYSSNSAPTGMGNIPGSGKMEGFGNSPQHQPKTTGQLLRDSLGNFLDKLTESPQSNQTFLIDAHKLSNNFAPVKLDQKTEILTQTLTDSLPRVIVPQHIPGKAGGGWDDDADVVQPHCLSSSHISNNKDNLANTELIDDRLDSEEYSLPEWNEEDQLVSEMIQNPRQIPSRTDLETFNTKCRGLNCDKILNLINHHLQTDVAKHSQLICLFMLEWLCRTDFVNLNLMASFSKDNLLNIYNSISSTRNDNESHADHTDEMLIKSKARKIIRTLEKLTAHKNILPMNQNATKSNYKDEVSPEEMTPSLDSQVTSNLPDTYPNIQGEHEEKDNPLDEGSLSKSVFDFIRIEEEKFEAEKLAKSNPEAMSPSGLKPGSSPHSPSLSLYSRLDTELSDASSHPSAGSEFSLLNDDSLETNEN